MQHFRLETADSTSLEARRRLSSGEALPFAVSALMQTAGRGRQGKAFFSPSGGIYLTVAFPAESLALTDTVPLTVRAAVSAAQSIEAVTGLSLGIKWVNDLYLSNKKVAGILTEAITSPETRCVTTILVGVGVNLTPPTPPSDFPDDLSLAGGLFPVSPTEDLRDALTEALLCGLSRDLMGESALLSEAILEEYRRRSTVLGRPVAFWQNGNRREGVAAAIDGEGALLVETEGGCVRLTSGEITLRPL